MHASTISSYKLRKIQKKRQRKRRIFVFLFLIIIITGILSFFVFSQAFHIKQIIITDTKLVKITEVYSQFKNISENKSLFHLIPLSNNILFIGQNDCNKIKNSFAALKNVYCQKNLLFRNIKIILEERQPKAIFCNNQQESKCFYLDEEGVVFFPVVNDNDKKSSLIFIKDDSGNVYQLGDRIPILNFNQIFSLATLLQEKLNFSHFVINKWDIIAVMENDSNIMIALDKIEESYNFLQKLLETDFNFDELQYLDLRFLPKIYYK